MEFNIPIYYHKEGLWFIGNCPVLGIKRCAESLEKAKETMKCAIEYAIMVDSRKPVAASRLICED